MTPREMRNGPLAEALLLLPAKMTSAPAEVLVLAIGLQESRFEHRRQLTGSPPKPVGPAKSFWQAEQGGGMVTGLLRYRDANIRDLAVGLCAVRGVVPSAAAVWNAIEHDDVLAAGLARLLLYTDPSKLPALGDVDGAWQLYLRTWRPGAHERGTAEKRAELRAKWGRNYVAAMEEVSV
ncbi:hypothetical protein [Pseudomonas sp. LRF_L74]|uniref:hypothetical protein n=1 Tax=Pseudomonas sp. LRF_L74 TaxID=3369422 RepID=UPI003F623351